MITVSFTTTYHRDDVLTTIFQGIMFIAELGKHMTSQKETPDIERPDDACQVSRLVSIGYLRTFSQSDCRFTAGTYYALVALKLSQPMPVLTL